MKYTNNYYSKNITNAIREKSNIVGVIGWYTNLVSCGEGRYKGACPFCGQTHDAQKPATLFVSEELQVFECLECGASGDVIAFTMKIRGSSFNEALQFLAENAKLVLPPATERSDINQKRERVLAINRDAAKLFHEHLMSNNNEGMAYAKKRGLNRATLRNFGIGYIGNNGMALYKCLKHWYTDEELVDADLIKIENGRIIPRLFNRLVCPIVSENCDVIGFSSRSIRDQKPKYINSSETLVFHKSHHLFGLYQAIDSYELSERTLILCEGNLDVITLHQAGFPIAVAGLGTALSSTQISTISKYADTVYIAYDNDDAGIKATIKAAQALTKAGLDVKIIDLAPYKDPDEFIKAEDPDEFSHRMETAQGYIEWFVATIAKNAKKNNPDNWRDEFLSVISQKLLKAEEGDLANWKSEASKHLVEL